MRSVPRLMALPLALFSVAFGAGCLFFGYYTLRLAWVNMTRTNAAAHRQSGMYVGAVAFPLAAVAFGFLSIQCARAAVRAVKKSP